MKEKKKYLTDLKEQEKVEDIFLVLSAQKLMAKNGPYWQLVLQDKSGQMQARIWSPLSLQLEEIAPESFFWIRGTVQAFGQELQLKIEELTPLSQEEIDLSQFLPATEKPPEEIFQELKELLWANIHYPLWKNLLTSVFKNQELKKAFLQAPGGKSIHHAYLGGLVEHTLAVCKICLQLSALYPFIDRDILLTAACLHDLGKAFELESSFSRNYTDEGKLLGHIFLGLEKLQPFLTPLEEKEPELILHLKHLILSHHGELEFGSPKRPKTPEAILLHFADNLDAKLNLLQQSLNIEPDSETEPFWSEYNRVLSRPLFWPKRTPRPKDNSEETSQAKLARINQCLLPLKE
ncbi:MAG: 3-5 exoribonuclease [Desulfonauticus sp.]|nr:3-5 exoribonuclease [Desulfonauticus sp.]